MKRMNRKLAMILLAALCLTFVPHLGSSAMAATKTVKALKYRATGKKIDKKATKIKKGTTHLCRVSKGWLKFTSKKTQKYAFTFYGLSTNNMRYSIDNNDAHIDFCTMKGKKYWTTKIKKVTTESGDVHYLNIGTNLTWKRAKERAKSTAINIYSYLPSRTAIVKVKKGQTLYLYLDALYRPFDIYVKVQSAESYAQNRLKATKNDK